MIKKHLSIILSLAICGIMVFSATKVKADTAYPTTIHDIESVGTYHFNSGTNHIDIYASDITNIHNELYSLGTYSADKITGYNNRLTAVDTTITNGKKSVTDKIKTYNSASTLTQNSSYSDIANALPTIYQKGYDKGLADTKSAIESSGGLTVFTDVADKAGWNATYTHSITNTTGHTVYCVASCGESHTDHDGVHISYAKIKVGGSVVAEDSYSGAHIVGTSWRGNVAAGQTVTVETKGGSTSAGSNRIYASIIMTK